MTLSPQFLYIFAENPDSKARPYAPILDEI